MPLGKSVQNLRGFVRGVGMTPSATDRQNKRTPVARIKEAQEVEQKTKLQTFEETQPEFFEEAKKFAKRRACPEAETQRLMVEYIENAIKETQRHQRAGALLDTYHKKKQERVTV